MVCFISFLNRVKKHLVLAFFLFTGLSIFAQNFREARIFVQPVNGTGMAGDNTFFYRQLTYEVVLQYYSLVRTQRTSDFILRGSIAPYTGEDQFLADNPQETPELFVESETVNVGPVPVRPIPRIRNTFGRREFFSWEIDGDIHFFDTTGDGNPEPEVKNEPVYIEESKEEKNDDSLFDEQEYVFILELINSLTGDVLAKQYIIYRFTDAAVGDLVSIIVYNMLTGIPDIEAENDWRDNWLFADASAVWAPRIYTAGEQSTSWVNFGIGVSLEFYFLDFWSLDLGVQLVQDSIVVSESTGEEYRDLILEIPLALKFVFKPLQFMMEPYTGVSFNFSLMGTTKPSFLSWFTGFQFGAKAGPGMIVIDPRFSMDLFNSQIVENPVEYQRYMFQISVGYKFGFLPKRARLWDY